MPAARGKAARALTYSIVGFVAEAGFSAIHDAMRGRSPKVRTSPWMLPIYALIQPLYEPLHSRLRDRNLLVRAAAYGVGFMSIEYTSGALLRTALGEAPWDHSEARWNIDGLVRADYFLYWAAAGLLLEHLDDALDRQGTSAEPFN